MGEKGTLAGMIVAVWLGTGAVSFGDEAGKTGAPVEYDFVQTAASASFKNGILTLNGVGATTDYFGERPNRDAGTIPHAEFLRSWADGPKSLDTDPPNASLVVNDGGKARIAIVELTNPELDGETIRYHAKLIGGNLPENIIGPASLFIDPAGLGFGIGAIIKFKQHKGNP